MDMKNKYVKPAVCELEFFMADIIATSPIFGVGEDYEDATTDASAKRDVWGNIWK